MGKAKRAKPSTASNKVPLDQDIYNSKYAKAKNRNKVRLRTEEDEEYVDSNLSKKIITAARKQQRELEESTTTDSTSATKRGITKLDDVNSESESDNNEEQKLQPENTYESIKINAEDEKAMEMFMSKNPLPRRTLADIIMEKITEKQTELDSQLSDGGSMKMQDLDPRLISLYQGIGEVLKNYRSGKLPKAFKMIPNYKNWDQVLHLTDPPSWSAAAMYQATRIFTSNLRENMAETFMKLVLLPRIRDDLAEYKRLNFHLYQALRKALYKPGAFMKGIVLALAESGNCTLREAVIIGSVIGEYPIPVFHSSTAMQSIAKMGYTGASSIFLRIFLDKRYSLPFRTVDELALHFIRFESDTRDLPVLWHQALLTFVQRYKNDITVEQRDNLLALVNKHQHHLITPEVRRELQNAKCRNVETKMDQ